MPHSKKVQFFVFLRLCWSSNPTKDKTTFQYSLKQTGKVDMFILNSLGEKVAFLLKDVRQEAGKYEIDFDTAQLPVGVYFYTFISGTQRQTKRLVIIR